MKYKNRIRRALFLGAITFLIVVYAYGHGSDGYSAQTAPGVQEDPRLARGMERIAGTTPW